MVFLRKVLPLLSIALLHGSLGAQPFLVNPTSKKSAVEFNVSNYGMFGLDLAKSMGTFIVPRGSGKRHLFGSGVYFVAQKMYKDSLIPLTFWTYELQGAFSDGTPGDLAAPAPDGVASLYHSELYDRVTGRRADNSDQTVWPLWLAPSVPASMPMSPGVYVSDMSRRNTSGELSGPAFLSGVDEQFVTRFHDTMQARYVGSVAEKYGLPIGLQFQQSIYAWSDGPLRHVVVLKYDIINISGTILTNCSVGQLADMDIGIGLNDHFAYYRERAGLRLGYAWSEEESAPHRVLLMTQLEGPVVDNQGFIDNSRRQEYRENGHVGICRGWTIETDPTRQLFYRIATTADLSPDDVFGDVRAIIGTELFSMRPGDTAHYAMAFAVIDDRPGTAQGDAQVDALVPLLNQYYYEGFPAAVAPALEHVGQDGLDLTLLPGTSRDDLRVRFSTGSHPDATLRLFNALGQPVAKLSRRMYGGEIAEESIDMSAFPAGIYFVELSSGGERVTGKMVR